MSGGGAEGIRVSQSLLCLSHGSCRSITGKLCRLGLSKNGLETLVAVLHGKSSSGGTGELDVAKALALSRQLVAYDVAIIKVSKVFKLALELLLSILLGGTLQRGVCERPRHYSPP